ncbi:retrotransposon protein, putative, Ty1-copia subclass [Drepanopeziza brunnea f. sp. 'multigermtubi' MB_m1]|uniref:Retrotransposon protein, putative, Ty1-copia subclass n=1 Tax=Marssonina brunnea f. sp. multigermtubi (strain MB_m1) TaxID=1072389 RepID=K1WRP0_MARBU|nr:retrotransposon protein, putative, Ty1-copia subclass [Drepanopeziza brunnea f. sp. 'multigermtubi' MB_m1]EKD15691.1 retrotransposon protein, putative, Ty1-copia subclass [Drepanopeziza brunnea f. sp. 'multigermtubi' MB_m1]
MNCEIPKPVLASLIFKGLLSSFDSFAFRKFKEISSNFKEVDIDSLISDLLSEEARIGTSADLKANKAFKNNAKYCSHCKQKGHLNSTCFKLHPELKPNFNKKPNNKAISAKDKDFKNGSSKALMSAFTNSSSNSELNHFGIAYSITNNNKFVLDSGASEHYSPNKAWFINYKPIAKKSIIIANGDIMPILSIGDIPIKSKISLEIIIKNVNYIPKLKTTLISSKELINKDWAINFDRNGAKISHASFKLYINVKWANNAYFIKVEINDKYLEPLLFKVDPFVTTKLSLYHKRLLHVNKDFVLKTIDNSEGLSKAIEQNLENCESCVFKLDNAREFTSNKWTTFCKSKSIICEYTSPYSPSQNGIAERLNRYLIERLISRDNKLADKDEKGLLVGFESANNYLIYLPSKRVVISSKNVLIKKDLKFKDELINEKSDYFDIIEEELPSTKSDDDFTTSIKSIDNTNNNQPNISQPRVVKIEEAEDQPYFDDTESRASDALSDLNTDPNKATVEAPKAPKTRGPAKDYSDQRPNVTTRSSKNNSFNLAITELNNRLIEEQIQAMSVYKNVTLLASMALISSKTDRNLDQGLIKLSDKNSSKKVVNKSASNNIKPLKTRWVYKIKQGTDTYEFKSKFVAKGFKQLYGLNYIDTFASVVKQMAWRLIFALAVLYGWFIYKIDIISAFTQSDIDLKLYIIPLIGINSSKYANKLLMLNKALYGLKQSARLWFITLKEVLIQKFSFTPLLADSCILYNKELKLIISVYVDDLALISPNIDTIKSFIKELQKYFKLKDLRLIKDYLGIDIEYDIKRGYMKLSQESYITKILNRFDMLDCKPKPIPIDSKAKLEPNPNKASASEITWFQQLDLQAILAKAIL